MRRRVGGTCGVASVARERSTDIAAMPSLTWLGRRWCLSSDDLFVPASCTAFVRSIGGALLWLQYCDGLSPSLRLACLATHCANTAAILLELLVIRQSTRGAVVDCESRDRAVRPLLTAHLVLSLGEVCLGVWAATQVEYVATDSCGVSLFLLRASLLAYLCSIVAGLTFVATLMKSGHAHAVAAASAPTRTQILAFALAQPEPEPERSPHSRLPPRAGPSGGSTLCACACGSTRPQSGFSCSASPLRDSLHTRPAPASASASVPPPPPGIPCGPPGCSCALGLVPGQAAAAIVAISLRHETLEARHVSRGVPPTDRCARPSSS